MFGLAYLVRPEAVVYTLVAASFYALASCWRGGPRRPALLAVTAMVVTTGLIMTPHVAWLSAQSGCLRVEGKSDLNGLLSERIHSGLTYHEAAQALGPNLAPVGVFRPLDQFAVRPHSGGVRAALQTRHRPLLAQSMVFTDPARPTVCTATPRYALARRLSHP